VLINVATLITMATIALPRGKLKGAAWCAWGLYSGLEVLFFSTRLLRSDLFELPVTADLHRAV